jgi:UDPglucose--hexose-1-phosphate uridylyltransferase
MSLLRYDVTTNDWVLFAPERSRRPHELKNQDDVMPAVELCPFCPGNEHLTGPEIYAQRGGSAGWFIRVVARILPMLTTTAGFELGSGMAINTVMPERAASYLREDSIS